MADDLPLIVFCSESHFDWQSRLLLRSLRSFGGRLSHADVISYSPRPDHPPSSDCVREFRAGGVEIICDPLNVSYANYPLANKILAFSDASERFPKRSIVFLDSDKIIMDEPHNLIDDIYENILLRPVDFQNIGAINYSDITGPYWKRIHDMAGAFDIEDVYTTLDKCKIMAYYNSGMIGVPPGSAAPIRWLELFQAAWKEGLSPGGDLYFLEQSALAAVVSASHEQVHILPEAYNVPIHVIADWPDHPWAENLNANVSIHYHKAFNHENRDKTFFHIKNYLSGEKYAWIENNISNLNRN